ncbi:putative sigma54 specific transcriptional regulator [Desulfovibrio sp. X2]|uniref:sigma 54-interacting transcriptional regulator n=1 Tax=Desulfovibrio sp. X2 TaxID=941449 RepID=UPI000358ECA9|nr:sigma 54-interacting transcriptional regulator [Desulfovibrio sp. X2]EPR37453.1 putative sigma54 specific transcriptional regulator [Desulfovibrio sp. X2]
MSTRIAGSVAGNVPESASLSGVHGDLAEVLSGPVLLEAFDLFPHALMVVDAEHRVRFLNKRMEALCGLSRERAEGLPCAQVVRSGLCGRDCPVHGEASVMRRESDVLTASRRRLPVGITSLCLGGGKGLRLLLIEDLGRVKDLEKSLASAAGHGGGRLLGRSREMERIFDVLPVIAQSEAPVLITGETGTGKDLAAEALHAHSARAREAFVRLNTSPMPEELLDSELFGHCKGAFPWAESDSVGRIQAASGGTIYVAELADLPVAQQAKLLRLLDEKLITPVGAQSPVRVDVRLLAATHRVPEELVREGRLRQDLLHRLAAVRLHLPALREREGDVEYLLQHFLETYAGVFHKNVAGFSPKALRVLVAYPWPGNVRELKNVVEYAVMVCQESRILPAHLPMHVLEQAEIARRRPRGQAEPREGRRNG